MTKGVYDIPVTDGTALVVPDAAIVPMNGFDAQGYRLGYGGGYFDRTLDSIAPPPLAIGVAFEFAGLPTIRPQPHDVPMDFIVTEAGIYVAKDANLVRISAARAPRGAGGLCLATVLRGRIPRLLWRNRRREIKRRSRSGAQTLLGQDLA
jgi:hypothetical protein